MTVAILTALHAKALYTADMTDIDDDTQINDQASRPDPFQKRDDGFFNPRQDEPHLPQDYDPPAAPPSDVSDRLPRDYPETDSNLEPSEVYDEGITGATDIDESTETDEPKERRVA